MAKRTLDILVAALGLALSSPVLVIAAIAVRLSLGSPVLFRQTRTGAGGCPFTIYKLRTMREAAGQRSAPTDAERLTALGRFLRETSVDELPSLWNVLTGEMSLVGPRPLLPEYLPRYTGEQARRHEVRPGVTGWSQIHGRNDTTWEERLEMDVWYVDHRSFLLDLRILLKTVPAVLGRSGISQDGHATMEPFQGAAGVDETSSTTARDAGPRP